MLDFLFDTFKGLALKITWLVGSQTLEKYLKSPESDVLTKNIPTKKIETLLIVEANKLYVLIVGHALLFVSKEKLKTYVVLLVASGTFIYFNPFKRFWTVDEAGMLNMISVSWAIVVLWTVKYPRSTQSLTIIIARRSIPKKTRHLTS